MSDRPAPKPLPIFALQAGALLSLLVLLLPSAEEVYPRWFHAQANAVFGWIGDERVVRLVAPENRSDTEMLGFERGRLEPRWSARFQIHERGYWPLLALVALVLPTPLPPGRRLLALAAALLLMNAFTLMQVGTLAAASYGLADATAAGDPGAWRRAMAVVEGTFNSEMPRAIAALLIWAVVARPGRTIDARASRVALREWWSR